MSKNIKVELGDVDCTSVLRSANKIETYGDAIATYALEFSKNVNDLVEISNALSVEVWLDSDSPPTTKVFNGFIDLFKPEAGIVEIVAKDDLAKLINKQVMHYYDKSVSGDPSEPDGKISDIFNDLVTTYGGLSTNSGATVQDSGTEVTLAQFPCRNADVFERCRKLAETLDWVFYYRADTGFVYFEPKNYTKNSNILTVGSSIIEIPVWEHDRSEMINDLRLEGAQQLVQGAETFTGDASETEFTLAHIPESIAVYYSAAKDYTSTAKLASEVMAGDIANSLSYMDYTVDKQNKQITFVSLVPASSADNILVETTYFAPIPVHLENAISKATYIDYVKTLTFTDVVNLPDAWKRAENIISKYSVPFTSAKLKVLWTPTLDVRVGQEIRVVDAINVPPVDQWFTVYKTTDNWPQATVDVEVGDQQYTIEEYQANVLERLKRLEETVIGTTESVTEIKQSSITFALAPSQTTILMSHIEDSFILGNPSNATLSESAKLGGRSTTSSTVTYNWSEY